MFTGCGVVMSPANATIYVDTKGPISVGESTTYSKIGRAECTTILGIVATGDASIQTATRNGQITKIAFVDYEAKNILGIYGTFTTIVYGD